MTNRFLLARLHMDTLASQPSIGHLKRAVNNLPKGSEGLDQVYLDALERINGQPPELRVLAKKVFSWLVGAQRPLDITELRHAIAIEPGSKDMDEDFLPDAETLDSVCAGLVTMRYLAANHWSARYKKALGLIHYTTQQFLARNLHSEEVHFVLAEACLTYLSYDTFESGPQSGFSKYRSRLVDYPLYNYAATYWGVHAQKVPSWIESRFRSLILAFLRNERKINAAGQVLPQFEMHCPFSYKRHDIFMSAMHTIAYFGLKQALELVHETPENFDQLNIDSKTPMYYAIKRGFYHIVEYILSTSPGLDLESACGKGLSPLSIALDNGHIPVAQLLLEHGADPNGAGGAPLFYAASTGNLPAIRTLLRIPGIVLNPPIQRTTNVCCFALAMVAEKGHFEVVKILANAGANLDLARPSVSAACLGGHEDIANFLISKGASTSQALFGAVSTGLLQIVELLLAKGCDVHEIFDLYDNGSVPMHAVQHVFILDRLIMAGAGADLERKNRWGQTPLLCACTCGNVEVVKRLLELGANVNAEDIFLRTPLSVAVEHDQWTILELLLTNKSKHQSPG